MTNEKEDDDKNIKKVIGIGDKLRKMDEEDLSDDGKKKRHEEHKERLAKIKADIRSLREKDTDEDFIKESLRELATIGLESMRVLQDEIEMDATGRSVECMAAMSNATSSALKNLQNVDIDKERLDLDKEKLAVKKTIGLGHSGNTTNNILVSGSVTDLVKMLKDGTVENEEEIEAEVIHEEDLEKRKGTPFPKKDK